MNPYRVSNGLAVVCAISLCHSLLSADPGVFDLPRIQAEVSRAKLSTQLLLSQARFAEAETSARTGMELVPHDSDNHFLLALALAAQSKPEAALTSLSRAIELGFNDVGALENAPELDFLKTSQRFAGFREKCRTARRPPNPWKREVKPAPVQDNLGVVIEENTVWDARLGHFVSRFDLPAPSPETIAVLGHGEAGEWLRQRSKEGKAAGNHGDYYNNYDGNRSTLPFRQFPQLTRIEFCKEAQERKLDVGLQVGFSFNGVVIGNSSSTVTKGPFWRSQPRLAYTNRDFAIQIYNQYLNNHLYVYPEHHDHDPGTNGNEEGYGDLYPANTPYLIISQGSLGSDMPFVDAVACTLAAFRPDTKQLLVEKGLLMPTVQMVLRSTYGTVSEPADYLTGKAHPSVFDGTQLNLLKMVQMAQGIAKDEVPPLVRLKVIEEDEAILGTDYFAPAPREVLFDTPCAIARIMRSVKYERRMVVSAEDSVDLNDRDLTYHWVVLRGDEKAIRLDPVNESGSIMEITVPWHERQPVSAGAELESNRVDIGCFVHNGEYYSAPAFVTFFSIASEDRIYERDQIKSVTYGNGNYTDPVLYMERSWRDEYRYDSEGHPLGWKRSLGPKNGSFTADGALIMERDQLNRPTKAMELRYSPKRRLDETPILEQLPSDNFLFYQYESDNDRIGKIIPNK